MTVKTFEIPFDRVHIVEHNLGTKTPLVTLWQGGWSIAPSVQVIDENSVRVNVYGEATLVLAAPPKTRTKSKSSEATNGKEAKSRSGTRSKAQGSKRSSRSGS